MCEKTLYPSTGSYDELKCEDCDVGAKSMAYLIYGICAAGVVSGMLWLMLSESGRETFVLFADTQGAADDIVGALNEVTTGTEDAVQGLSFDRTGVSGFIMRHIGKVKALASFYQIIAAIPMVFGASLSLPFAYRMLNRVASVFMLDLMELVPTRCLTSISNEMRAATSRSGAASREIASW